MVEDSVIADSLEAECGNNHDSTYMEPIGNFLPTPPTVDGCHNMVSMIVILVSMILFTD